MKKLLYLFIFILSGNLIAQENDCVTSGAGEITVENACNPITFNSSNNSDYWNGASGCGAADLDDAWGWFTGTGNDVTITYTPGSDDAILTLFTGSCSTTMSSLSCSNSGGAGVAESITVTTTSGQVYMIRIQRSGVNNSMSGTLCVYDPLLPAPGNGTSCSDAVTLTPGTQQCGTNDNVGDFPDGGGSPTNPCSSSYNDGEYWFQYTGTGDALQLDVSGLTDTWSGIFVLDACPGSSPACVASYTNGSSTANYSVTTSALTAGQTYYIVIANFAAPYQTDFCLDATEIPPPPPCSGDLVINTTTYSATGLTTCGFGDDFNDLDACGSYYMNGEDIVIEYTPTSSECVSINLSNTLDYTGVFITTNCPDEVGTTCLASGTSWSGDPAILGFSVTAGTTYFITVSTNPSPNCTDFDLDISICPPPPTNDECTGAIGLTVNSDFNCGVTTSGTIESATGSPEVNDCFGTPDDDVWYSFVATNSTHTIDLQNVTGSVTDMYHSIYSGSCGSFDPVIECSDANSSVATGLTPGQTYYVRVYTYTSTYGQNTSFDICVGTPPPPPTNDECNSATPVGVNTDGQCTIVENGTVGGATESSATNDCFGTADDDVWFSFVATASDINVNLVNITGSTTDLYHSVYETNNCNNVGTPLVCSDPNFSTLTGLTVGNTYYVRVYSYTSTAFQTTSFDICVSHAPPTPTNVTCPQMQPICSGQPIAFTAQSNGSDAEAGNNYDCLSTYPNPSWYYLEISQSGDMAIDITAGDDIDFALWGPYNDLADAQSDCGSLPLPIDCSYSSSEIELADEPSVVAGEVYLLLVTNYADVTQTIFLNEASAMTAETNCAIVILPAELDGIIAFRNESNVIFNWNIASELNCDFYEAQKSIDGIVWETFDILQGQGTTDQKTTYQTIDERPSDGINYYRYKQFDINGHFKYSPVQIVAGITPQLTLYPVPANNKVYCDLGKETLQKCEVVDMSGKIIPVTTLVENGKFSMDTRHLVNGMYLVKMITNQSTSTIPLQINHH